MREFVSAMLAVACLVGLSAFVPPRLDFPFLAKPMFGVLEWAETTPESRGFVFNMGLVGRPAPLYYDCTGRNCVPFNSLRDLAAAEPPLEVRYVAMGDELVMLTVDGRKVIRPWIEQMRLVWLRLFLPVLALLVTIRAFRRLIAADRLSEAST